MKADKDVAAEKECPPPCDEDDQSAMSPANPDGDSSPEIVQLRGRM